MQLCVSFFLEERLLDQISQFSLATAVQDYRNNTDVAFCHKYGHTMDLRVRIFCCVGEEKYGQLVHSVYDIVGEIFSIWKLL